MLDTCLVEEVLLAVKVDTTPSAVADSVSDTGVILPPTRRKPYEVPAAIKAYAELFAIVRTRDAACPDVEPLQRASADIKAGEVGEGG